MICKNCGRDNCGMTKIKLPTACYHRSTALGPCASCVDRHVREVADASRDCVAHIAGPFTADDWQGMYHVAAKRAQDWEDRAKADRWIPVTERLPDYGVTVDVWDSERGRVPDCDRVCLSDAGDVWSDIHGEDLRAWSGEDNVTHWRMPPKPPEVKS